MCFDVVGALMEIRLYTRPAMYHVSGGELFVGTFGLNQWFVVYAKRRRKDFPGYITLWRFKENYPSRQDAMEAAKRWQECH